jgi:hypothetical protein
MGSVGPPHLIALLLVVAIIAASVGFLASTVALRNKRRSRGFFVLGVITGFTAAAITRGKYRRVSAIGQLARGFTRPRNARKHRGARPLVTWRRRCVER